MFPTGVGMNRIRITHPDGVCDVPHRRGDEPICLNYFFDVHEMFPTGVGMNRWLKHNLFGMGDVPHRRGDEPGISECYVSTG